MMKGIIRLFLILATSLILVFFYCLFRTNPQLTLDYLNFAKTILFKRSGGKSKYVAHHLQCQLLFYLFCSLLASLALITALHFSPEDCRS